MPISEVNRFLPPAANAPIVIASREAPGAIRYDEPAYRHITGRVFNGLIRALVLPGLQDTQCGFKMFRADVAEDLFKRQTLMGWSFDVELLYIASLRGLSILEIPIPGTSTLRAKSTSCATRGACSATCLSSAATGGSENMPETPGLHLEQALWAQGYKFIGGMDEAGRGAWAGPVMAGLVILPADPGIRLTLAGVRDSKKMTALQRSRAALKQLNRLPWPGRSGGFLR
jgi:hypothetical protein